MREAGMTGAPGEISKVGKRRRLLRCRVSLCCKPRRAIQECTFPSHSPENRFRLRPTS